MDRSDVHGLKFNCNKFSTKFEYLKKKLALGNEESERECLWGHRYAYFYA